MITKLIAVDPGKMTGFAVFDTSNLDAPTLIYSAELDGPDFEDTLSRELYAGNEAGEQQYVVFEKFTITAQTAKNTDAPWSLEEIGVTKYLCRKYEVPWAFQTPAAAKNFSTNERLKSVGMWHKGGAGHANDAIRHGVLFLVEHMSWASRDLLV